MSPRALMRARLSIPETQYIAGLVSLAATLENLIRALMVLLPCVTRGTYSQAVVDLPSYLIVMDCYLDPIDGG
jgi:hypothetical protein